MSANVIAYAREGNFWEFDGQRYFDATQTFSRANRLDGVAKNELRVPAPEDKSCESRILDFNGIGALMAFALSNGITWLRFDSCSVSVNYLAQALAFRGKHNWFIDVLDHTEDHDFDGNSPTPGFHVGEAKKLTTEAASLEEQACLFRAASRISEASEFDRQAQELRTRARELRTGR